MRSDAQGGAGRVPQDGCAESGPDQHQVRWRRVEPHNRQSCHQVRGELSCFFIETFLIIIIAWISWDFRAESQANFCIHRLGQETDVFVKRFVMGNTIEERMLRFQDVKTGAHLSPFLIFIDRFRRVPIELQGGDPVP